MGGHSTVKMAEDKQLEHMKRFILHEAMEKVDEINCAAEQAFFVDKNRLVSEARRKLEIEFERKASSVSSKQKIGQAKEGSKHRLELLKEQEDIMSAVIRQAGEQIQQQFGSSGNQQYAKLMEELILQSLAKMGDEPKIYVYCLVRDVDVAQQAVQRALERYKATNPENGAIDLSVDTSKPLPELHDANTGEKCYGGVAVSNADRTIVCQNTLNARLQIAAESLLPRIKTLLFPDIQAMLQQITLSIVNGWS